MTRIMILLYAFVMSLIAFAAFGIDKYKAKAQRWRIRERTLFALALMGGGIGAFLGMKVFHHKTRHRKFAIGIPVIMVIQLILLGFALWKTTA